MRRAVWLALVALGCGSRGLSPGEGYIQVPGGRVWYRVVGSGTRTPLLLLHGGPGVPGNYLKPLAGLAQDRPVVFYDQLGAGKSDHPTDTSLWHMDRFVTELARVREALGLRDIHLYGHSWGAVLATEYLLTRPAGVHSLILAGPVLSLPRYRHEDDSLAATLPEPARATLAMHARAGTCEGPDFQAALMAYYQHFYVRKLPLSIDLDSSMQVDPVSGAAMFGPCGHGGPLAALDVTARMQAIAVPTLFIVGGYDPATPATARYYQSLIEGSELVVFDSAGHLPMQDEPERYNQVIRDFLRRVEKP